MGVNVNGISVLKSLVHQLSWKEQTVLISAIRGCDVVGKNDISKKIVRKLRNVVLNNAGPDGCEFMECDISDEELYNFSKNIDAYPVHFLLHIIHASEIVGYCCDDEEEKNFFKNFYYKMVDAFHMRPENEEDMHKRLMDGSETCCHKS